MRNGEVVGDSGTVRLNCTVEKELPGTDNNTSNFHATRAGRVKWQIV